MAKPTSDRLAKGTIINSRYEVLRWVGEGGQKRVYEAKDLNMEIDKRIVLKEMKRSASQDMDLAAMQLFEQESIILMQLKHHALPGQYDFFIDQGTFYIIQEYVDGQELDAYLAKGYLSEVKALETILQLAKFLDFLHSRKPPIIFRDLKPANVMIDSNSNLFIVDMSGALLPGIGTMAEKVKVKTAGYFPPDAPNDDPGPDKDVYALGIVLYETLTRFNPGKCEGKPPPLSEFRDNISPEIDSILNKTVFYSRIFRIHTSWEIKIEIEEALRSLKKFIRHTEKKSGILTSLYTFFHKFYVKNIKTFGPLLLLFLIAGIPIIPHLSAFFFEEKGYISPFPPHISYYFGAYTLLIYFIWVRALSQNPLFTKIYKFFHKRSKFFGGYRLITLLVTLSFFTILMFYGVMVVEIISQFL